MRACVYAVNCHYPRYHRSYYHYYCPLPMCHSMYHCVYTCVYLCEKVSCCCCCLRWHRQHEKEMESTVACTMSFFGCMHACTLVYVFMRVMSATFQHCYVCVSSGSLLVSWSFVILPLLQSGPNDRPLLFIQTTANPNRQLALSQSRTSTQQPSDTRSATQGDNTLFARLFGSIALQSDQKKEETYSEKPAGAVFGKKHRSELDIGKRLRFYCSSNHQPVMRPMASSETGNTQCSSVCCLSLNRFTIFSFTNHAFAGILVRKYSFLISCSPDGKHTKMCVGPACFRPESSLIL